MADYKELLRRAVEALPENNGAARRAVYEKARAALVGQLRAINPPLAARDITSHRLQLEDCIRQVEQEASEANIAGLNAEPPKLPPVFAAEAKKPARESRPVAQIEAKPVKAAPVEDEAEEAPPPKAKPVRARAEAPKPRAESEKPRAELPRSRTATVSDSIEDIIAAAERDRGSQADDEDEAPEPAPVPVRAPELRARPQKSQPVLVARSEPPEEDSEEAPPVPARRSEPQRQLPSIVARAEAAKRGGGAAPSFSIAADNGRRAPAIEPRREGGRMGLAATARQVEPFELDIEDDENVQAMAAVREVEVEQPADPQGAIDRAIATLDREARGEAQTARYTESEVDLDEEDAPEPVQPVRRNGKANGKGRATGTELVVSRGERNMLPPPEREAKAPRPAKEFANPRRAQAARAFDGVPRATPERRGLGAVAIFAIIFGVLLAGAGGGGYWAWQEGYLNLDTMFGRGTPAVATAAAPVPVAADSTGPGNTETPPVNTEPTTQLKSDERMPTEVAATTPAPVEPLALVSPNGAEAKIEERLNGSAETAAQAVAAIDPSGIAGSQSLLLEASDNGSAGAVPFSGTVDWSRGVDEVGQPTLIGKASIPARNLNVELLIRKNSDPSLPASHLMEINFIVTDSFIGGSIAGLPGVLLKNEELVQGTPLVGASARVVGNQFLFALSATSADNAANTNLLTTRKWIDLALIYASGKRAIITLEKDPTAQALFAEVFTAWGPPVSAPSSAG